MHTHKSRKIFGPRNALSPPPPPASLAHTVGVGTRTELKSPTGLAHLCTSAIGISVQCMPSVQPSWTMFACGHNSAKYGRAWPEEGVWLRWVGSRALAIVEVHSYGAGRETGNCVIYWLQVQNYSTAYPVHPLPSVFPCTYCK